MKPSIFLQSLILCLLIGLIFVLGFYINLYHRFEVQKRVIQSQQEEIRTLRDRLDQLAPLLELVNISMRNPPSHFDRGIIIVSGYSVEYWSIKTDHGVESNRDFFVVFYAPEDNLTLRISLFFWPREGLEIPLTLQEGNAFHNESGIRVGRRGNITIWQSPIIWSMNTSSVGSYETTLPYKGWYTLCITGPIQIDRPNNASSHPHLQRILNPQYDYIQINVDFRLLRDDEPILFAVDRNPL